MNVMGNIDTVNSNGVHNIMCVKGEGVDLVFCKGGGQTSQKS